MNFIPLLQKDLLRAFRSVFGLAMAFVTPLLITVIIAFAFGGFSKDDPTQVKIQTIPVAVANLDSGSGGFSAGDQLVQFLKSDDLKDLVIVQEMPDAAAAIAEVQAGNAAVAVIIPAGVTQAVTAGTSQAEIQLTSDPTLTLGPSIVQSLISQYLDGYNGAAVAREVVIGQIARHVMQIEPDIAASVMTAYGQWVEEGGSSQNGVGLQVQAPPAHPATSSGMARVFALILAGQMVFFAFWTSANNALSLLREQEEGTLARMFTTPVSRRTVLAARFTMVAGFILVQVLVLVLLGRLILNIQWGSPAAVIIASLGLIISSAGFGVFVISLLKNTRQAGAVLGGLLTVMGILSGLFTVGFTNIPAALNLGTYFTPHGWAMRLWRAAIEGAPINQAFLPLVVCLAAGLLFFAAGYHLFSKKFA